MTAERSWLGHRCGVATTPSDLDGCEAVLEQVRVHELRRGVEGSSLESHSFGGQQVDSDLLYVRAADSAVIVGCLRLTLLTDVAHIEASRAEYGIDVLPEDHIGSYALLTRFALRPKDRGSAASLSLLIEMTARLMDRDLGGALLACEPGLLGLYIALGARPLGSARRSPTGGYRVPMICITDADALAQAGSLMAEYVDKMDGWQRAKPLQVWYDGYVEQMGTIETGVRSFDPTTDGAVHTSLTTGMSAAGIEELVKNAQVVQCRAGDLVLAANDGSAFVGIVSSGAVEIHSNGHTLALLPRGEIFGELAFTRQAPRSADVMALSDDTEVVLLSRNAVDRVSDPHDQIALWQNLARCVADRLAMRNPSI